MLVKVGIVVGFTDLDSVEDNVLVRDSVIFPGSLYGRNDTVEVEVEVVAVIVVVIVVVVVVVVVIVVRL